MRVLAITHQYPTPGQPTFAPYNRQQFGQLARLHELRIIRPVPWPIAVREAWRAERGPAVHTSEDGIEVHTPTFRFPPRVWSHWYGTFFERSIAGIAGRLLDEYRPDVLLSAWAHPDGWATTELGQRAGLPVVAKVHGSDVLVLAKGRRRARIAEALRAADAVVAVSQDLARQVVRLGVPADRVHVVSHGIDSERFAPGSQPAARERLGLPAEGRVILFVGNVLVSKGAADLVGACARLRDRGRMFHCRLVGQGRDAGRVEELVHAMRLGDRVQLTGVRPQTELADWYRASDVVALPSYSEGVPNVLREALACGRPFVATEVGGIPEIADPSYSRLVQTGDIGELADALAAMLDAPPAVDRDLVRRISITWEESARQLAGLLEAVVDMRRARPRIARAPRLSRVADVTGGPARGSIRVLAITHQYPTPWQPTFAPYNRQQFGQLARLHDLRIIRPVPWPMVVRETLRAQRRPATPTSEDGIEVHLPTFRFPPRMLSHLYGVFFERSVAGIAGRLLDEYRPDVLLSAWAHPDGWAATEIGRQAGLPVVVKVLGSDVLVLAKGRRRARITEALRAADAVVAVSQDLARQVVRLGVPADRVHVVSEGIDSERFAPGSQPAARERLGLPAEGRVILFVGNVLVSKGAADLVGACARLRDRGRMFHCRLVGQRRDAGRIEELVHAMRLGDRVQLTGVRPQTELADWYRASDVVALPSYSEGVPNVLREALACGRPFVATEVGGIPEIADPSYSRLVQTGDIGELADALAAMLDAPPAVDRDLVRRISITWEESARQLAGCLEAVVDERKARDAVPAAAQRVGGAA